MLLVLALLFILGFLLGIVLSRSPVAPLEAHESLTATLPSDETATPADTSESIVVLGIRNVPEENPAVPEVVAATVEESPVPEIVLAVPSLGTPPLPEVISDIPPQVDEPAAKQQEVPESPKLFETAEPAAKPAVKLTSHLYFYTGVPVQPPLVKFVLLPPPQWVVSPVFVPYAVTSRVRTYQYFYSTGFATTTTFYYVLP